jgi:hypothetical protein
MLAATTAGPGSRSGSSYRTAARRFSHCANAAFPSIGSWLRSSSDHLEKRGSEFLHEAAARIGPLPRPSRAADSFDQQGCIFYADRQPFSVEEPPKGGLMIVDRLPQRRAARNQDEWLPHPNGRTGKPDAGVTDYYVSVGDESVK